MDDDRHDPYEPPVASPRGATALVVVAFVCALLALIELPLVFGPAGMVTGLLAHVKGHRAGFAAAIVAGVTTVVGMSLLFFFANPFQG